jgi:hypothetical protein
MNDEIIEKLHKETGLPIDYLTKEQELSYGDLKVNCAHFEHWDLISRAYSYCSYYEEYFIISDVICKDCHFYKKQERNQQ